ncbi:hypothetical protein HAX54_017497 [Datura stramonium]|uniref:Uncharacterized protein n=1 Tax=Datura stramonium TaxID=4076 RepID=A0ABS8S191_DATST|nr:hypothetical protein [Datura stramonium]
MIKTRGAPLDCVGIYCLCDVEEASSVQDEIFIFALKHYSNIIRHHESCSAFFISPTEIEGPKMQPHFLYQVAKTLKRVTSSFKFKEIGRLKMSAYISLISSLMR